MDEITVAAAAARLELSPTRVRALITAGDLPARKLGDQWIIDPDDVDAVATRDRVSGRPWSPRMAWGFIALAEGREPFDLSAPERSRLRHRLRHHAELGPLVQLTRKRAETHRLHVHRGALVRASDWPGAVPTGTSAPGHDLVKTDSVDIYLPARALTKLLNVLRATEASGSEVNLIVRVPTVDRWPFLAAAAGPVTVALDLWEAGDDRSRRSAQTLFTRAMSAPHAGGER